MAIIFKQKGSTMPYTPEHKQQSKHKILDSAYKLFTQKGFEHVSIDELMADAGLTRGAFYAHFKSKSELYAESMRSAAKISQATQLLKSPGDSSLITLIRGYLSRAHVKQETDACPLAFLATDVATRDEQVKSTYTSVFNQLVTLLERRLSESESQSQRSRALALTALLIGGVAVGRALDDADSVKELLLSCQELALELAEMPPELASAT